MGQSFRDPSVWTNDGGLAIGFVGAAHRDHTPAMLSCPLAFVSFTLARNSIAEHGIHHLEHMTP